MDSRVHSLTGELNSNNNTDKPDDGENGPNQPKILVNWQGTDDPLNPDDFSFAKRMGATLVVSGLASMVGAASSIDAAVLPQSSAEFHVSEVAGSLATGMWFPLHKKHISLPYHVYPLGTT